MHRRCRPPLLALVLLAAWLPLAAFAQVETPSSEPERVRVAPQIYGSSGKLERVTREGLVLRRMGHSTQPNAPKMLRIAGGPLVPVSGEGRSSWGKLRKGDLVVVSYRIEPVPAATKVLVLPPTAHPLVASAVGATPAKAKGRQFTGWVKYKDESLLVVRTPDALTPHPAPGRVRTFVRHEGTEVTLFRDSWDELKKGDRVIVHFQKGNPRPADLVKVVLRGGEKPLPPGLATRLFDPTYDRSVKDVDGIGEVPPGQQWEPPNDRSSSSASASN
jgi:hypothetical protein